MVARVAGERVARVEQGRIHRVRQVAGTGTGSATVGGLRPAEALGTFRVGDQAGHVGVADTLDRAQERIASARKVGHRQLRDAYLQAVRIGGVERSRFS